MTEDDIPGVSEVRVRGWQQAYAGVVPPAQLDSMTVQADIERRRGFFRDPVNPADNLVASVEGTVRGWACVAPSRDEDAAAGTGEIWAIYVHPSVWRQGIGRALMRSALQRLSQRELTPVTLWVLEANPHARSFYERCGFVTDGSNKQFPIDGGSVTEVRYVRGVAADAEPTPAPRA